MGIRALCAAATIMGSLAVWGGAVAADPPTDEVILIRADFDPAAKQWTVGNDGKTQSELRYEDGILKFFPGLGADSKGRFNWQGKIVSRRVQLYADYAIELQMAWDARNVRAGCRAFIEPRSGRQTALYVIFHLDKRAIEVKDTAKTVGWTGGLPETGKGALRFERRGQSLRVFWGADRLAEVTDEAPQVVDNFVVQLKNLPQQPQKAWVGLAGATVSVPKPDLPLADAPIAGRADQQKRLMALVKELQAMLNDFSARAYKRETTLEVFGFDLAAIKDKPQHDALAQRVKAFGERSQAIDRQREPLAQLSRRAGSVVQFFDRVPTEAVAKVEADAAALKQDVTKLFAPVDAEEQQLRKELAAIRPARTGPRQDSREWARNQFHIYWFNHYGNLPPGYEDSLRYMGEMGATLLQEQPYRGVSRHGTWESYVTEWRRKMDLLQRENMRLSLMGGEAIPIHPHPDQREAALKNVELYLKSFGDHPAFAGFEFDEVHYGNCWCKVCMPMFREYLKKRFSLQEMVALGLVKEKMDELDQIAGPAKDERVANPVLYTLRMEWRAQVFEETARAVFDRAHELRPDALMHTLLSPANFTSYTNRDWGGPFGAPLYRMAAISDMITIDPYWNGVPEEAYWCDLMRAHAKGPALLTVGMGYDARTVNSIERDLCIPFAHADGMYVFDWMMCFKQPPYLNPTFVDLWMPPGKWDKVWAVAQKAKKLEPYLVRTEPPRAVALVHSMRSQALELYKADLASADPGRAAAGMPGIYPMRQMGLYSLFRQARVQPDPVYAEALTPAMLKSYAVLFVPNAMAMTPEEEEALRVWVRDGGRLIATASTTLLDRWGRPQKDYRLADLFGVSYVGTNTLDKVVLKAVPELTYSGARDVVRPTTGRALLAWPDGAPAVVENSFGKGKCVYLSARDLGLNYTAQPRGAERALFNVCKTFSPGVVDFVRGLVVKELAGAGREPPFAAAGAPPEVEITLRVQRAPAPRRILHLLNYGYTIPVRDVKVTVPLAPGREVRAFYPVDDAPAVCRRDGDRLEIAVREFNVHEAVVVEERP